MVQQRSLSRTALQLQTDDAFWSYCLPRDRLQTGHRRVGGLVPAAGLDTIRELAAFHEPARLALNACAFMCLGRVRDDQVLTQQGAQLYARALRATNLALQNLNAAQSDGVLA